MRVVVFSNYNHHEISVYIVLKHICSFVQLSNCIVYISFCWLPSNQYRLNRSNQLYSKPGEEKETKKMPIGQK
ncbi:hypothetical protein DERP_010474 [Dermatophagoides pteronyssinus]|uniref:Uncharacterized protein n=1 Tax=Dermatophagoides pteronyssinus TaxID=6956 RepID=A0ABQ8J504_DERPT|nr:hypothetical protein DERP_010474 [Dermatophagoides pteronyssinus]